MRSSNNNRRRVQQQGLVLAAVLLALSAPGHAQAAPAADGASTGRVIVMPRAGLSDSELGKIAAGHGGKLRRIGQTRLYIIDLPASASDKAVAAALKNHPQLKFAEPDQRIEPDLSVSDPYAGSEWHLGKINAPTAWDTTMGSGVTIAVLDSGVDASHPDLAARMVPGWNFYDNNSNTADVYGHGTKVAGSAAAATNNATGVAALAGGAAIMPIRVTDTAGYGYSSAVAQGLSYAADRGVRVANISFSFAGNATVMSAAQYMKDKGGLVFMSAGNTGTESTVAPSTSVVIVSATDVNDNKASWSTWGNFVSLAAPGDAIYTTTSGGGYGAVSGTSFAAPISASVAAVVFATQPTLTSAAAEKILFSTATDLGAAGRDNVYGYGRIDAAAAVAAARNYVSTADTTAPTVAIAAPLGSATVSGLAAVNVNASDNVGVARVELRVNGALFATDTSAPYAFSWDTTKLANGSASLTAVAYDAAGNAATSQAVTVNIANAVATPAPADTVAPVVAVTSPAASSTVPAGSVTVSTSASDNAGAAGISQSLYIDGKLVASATGGSLNYKWNTRKVSSGTHTLQIVARDAAGNTGSSSVQVKR